jgi:hypothetical protein
VKRAISSISFFTYIYKGRPSARQHALYLLKNHPKKWDLEYLKGWDGIGRKTIKQLKEYQK